MGSYFGNIQNAERTQLKFDRVYSSRKAMEDQLALGDGVFVGRFVLVEYDDNTNARRRGYLKNGLNLGQDGEYELYMDRNFNYPYKLTESDENGYGVFPDDLFYAESGQLMYYFRCLNKTANNGNALFRSIYSTYSDVKITDYELNYKYDKEAYPDMPLHGYDSTIWRKTLRAGKEIYQMIASLNSVMPSFNVEEDAPQVEPIAPHFGSVSNNQNLYFHLPAQWAFKVKEADLENGEKSDVDVKYQYKQYDPLNKITKDVTKEYPGAIYYNKAGFDSLYHNEENEIETEISLLPTGMSGKAYYDHETDSRIPAIDTQELILNLPEIGNAIANVWDIVYGPGEQVNELQIKRNKDISWNSYNGLRLVKIDPKAGGFTFLPQETENLAGCINTAHDLIGMIVVDNTDDHLSLDDALPDKIYYRKCEEGSEKKGYFFKNLTYKIIPFSELEDFNEDEWVGGRTYQDLIKFEAGKYYLYSDGNFLLDQNSTFTKDTLYYELGEGQKVKLKQWNPVKKDPENPQDPGKITYYYYKDDLNNYYKDTSEYPDESKNYYTIDPTQVTYPEPDIGQSLTRLWNPQEMIIDRNFDPSLVDPEELIAMKITGIGFGYFYWDPETSTLVPLDENSAFNKEHMYYYIDQFAIAEGSGLEGEISESLYFIDENKKLISFSQAQEHQALLNKYYVRFLELKDNYYYSEMTGSIEGYECLHPAEDGTWVIDNEKIYYTIVEELVTDLVPGDDEEPEQDPEGDEEPEEDLFEHFYKPGFYFYKSVDNNFILATEEAFNPDAEYWRITNKEENFIEKDEDTGLWKIDPINLNKKFYEPNKYFYFSKKYQKDTIDTSIEMKELSDPDVVLEETKDGLIYYITNIAYVYSDESGVLSYGQPWDKDCSPPADVVLGKRVEEYQWTELNGFSRSLNTINGLILNINKMFNFNDNVSREADTISGCLNKIKDVLKVFRHVDPGETIRIDEYGNYVGVDPALLQLNKYGENKEYDERKILPGDTIGTALLKLEDRIVAIENKLGI